MANKNEKVNEIAENISKDLVRPLQNDYFKMYKKSEWFLKELQKIVNRYTEKTNNDKIYKNLRKEIYNLYKLGFTRVTVSRIFGINPSSLEAIEKGISYRELGYNFKELKLTKYKDLPNIKLPSYIRDYFKDNTVLNTLIAQGKVSV